MKMITSFDPSAATSGQFDPQVANPCGGVYLFNESDTWLQLTLPDGGIVGLPAWWSRFYKLSTVNAPVKWMSLATINSVARPLSQVYGESYERNEIVGRNFYDGPIPRNPFIANNVSSSVSTNQVVNDGNPAVTNVIEATQQGNTGGSNVSINNDGSFQFAQWVASVYTNLFQLIPGASPLLRLGTKLIIEAVDQSGANLSNIFGIDSSGNTFLQNHATNNQTIIYDKNGVAIAKFDANRLVNIPGNQQSTNGDTSGTMTITEIFSGPFKLVLISQSNYRQNGGAVNITLKSPFTAVVGAWTLPALGGIQLAIGGVAQTLTILTGFGTGAASGSTTTATQMNGSNLGAIAAAITQVGTPGGQASAHTSAGILFGI